MLPRASLALLYMLWTPFLLKQLNLKHIQLCLIEGKASHQAQSATGHEPWHTKRGGCGNALVAWSQQSGCLWECFKGNRSQQRTPKRNGKQRYLKSLPPKGERTELQLMFWNAFFLISCCVSDYEMIDWSRRDNPSMWREIMKKCQGMGHDKSLQLFL